MFIAVLDVGLHKNVQIYFLVFEIRNFDFLAYDTIWFTIFRLFCRIQNLDLAFLLSANSLSLIFILWGYSRRLDIASWIVEALYDHFDARRDVDLNAMNCDF